MSIANTVIEQKIIDDIIKAIKSIRFGYVQIIIHDSHVAQIDKTEKIRFKHREIEKGGK